ncbi:hypothetical protein RvY_03734-1 [Ramazzottius varieornatus]|uniref:Uncharacterized protein n=1 Tax=Ramazzottius varieornatus TaxID=947166 RepID=A0A1D1UP53_RAMVA|nr:hypothetical protein RvY_03734-1 [Ramazzottius varieornatus]
MDSYIALFILGLTITLTHGLPLDESAPLSREKRAVFPFVLGQSILDIQCQPGSITVCAPDGPAACPTNYNSIGQKGSCGFATLQRYLVSSDISGTCCVYNTASATTAASKISSFALHFTLLGTQLALLQVQPPLESTLSFRRSSPTQSTPNIRLQWVTPVAMPSTRVAVQGSNTDSNLVLTAVVALLVMENNFMAV